MKTAVRTWQARDIPRLHLQLLDLLLRISFSFLVLWSVPEGQQNVLVVLLNTLLC